MLPHSCARCHFVAPSSILSTRCVKVSVSPKVTDLARPAASAVLPRATPTVATLAHPAGVTLALALACGTGSGSAGAAGGFPECLYSHSSPFLHSPVFSNRQNGFSVFPFPPLPLPLGLLERVFALSLVSWE